MLTFDGYRATSSRRSGVAPGEGRAISSAGQQGRAGGVGAGPCRCWPTAQQGRACRCWPAVQRATLTGIGPSAPGGQVRSGQVKKLAAGHARCGGARERPFRAQFQQGAKPASKASSGAGGGKRQKMANCWNGKSRKKAGIVKKRMNFFHYIKLSHFVLSLSPLCPQSPIGCKPAWLLGFADLSQCPSVFANQQPLNVAKHARGRAGRLYLARWGN